MSNKLNAVALVKDYEGKLWIEMDMADFDALAQFIATKDIDARLAMARQWVADAKPRPKVLFSPEALGLDLALEQRPPLQLVRVTRADALRALTGRFAGLSVGPTYATGQLTRTLHNPAADDRFVSLANLIDGKKTGEAVAGLWLILIEIDDPALEMAAEFGGEPAIEAIALEHIEKATRALSVFYSIDGKKPAPYPFLATYSGKKSIHCLWWVQGSINRAQWETLKNAKNAVFAAKENFRKTCPELLEIDPAPLFSGTAMARIPCEFPEPNRRPQIGWRTGSNGTLSAAHLLEICEKKSEAFRFAEHLKKMQSIIRNNNNNLDPKGQHLISDNLLLSLGIKADRRNGGGWLISCPTHEDKTPSAFVSETGFVYCSVCCGGGRSHCARITSNGIEKSI